jgi:hypothetical protein
MAKIRRQQDFEGAIFKISGKRRRKAAKGDLCFLLRFSRTHASLPDPELQPFVGGLKLLFLQKVLGDGQDLFDQLRAILFKVEVECRGAQKFDVCAESNFVFAHFMQFTHAIGLFRRVWLQFNMMNAGENSGANCGCQRIPPAGSIPVQKTESWRRRTCPDVLTGAWLRASGNPRGSEFPFGSVSLFRRPN